MATSSSNRAAKFRHDYQSPAYLISRVNLCFELDPVATKVTSVMQIHCQRPGAMLTLDGQQIKLLSVALNGITLTADQYRVDENSLSLANVPEQCELTLVTQISPADNTALEGLYLAGNTFCTQCEAEGFRRISYFLDRPDVLAEYSVTIKADAKQYPYLLSNGNKVAEHIDANGIRTVQWHDPFPKPSYLFALVAGDFDRLSDTFVTVTGREVNLQLFVEKGQSEKGQFALQALKRAMRWDEQRFNLEYDLDIYMVVAVDFFNMGAMENKGLNIFNSKYVLADARTATDRDYFNIESIIGHEYFHNWTGNRVTCRDWFQLSLKEGLTVFRDQEFSADMGSATLCRIDAVKLIRTAQFAEDASPMAHPIRPESVLEMNNFYTVTVYDKGAEVIRMLQTILGQTAFNAGLALYLKRHDGQAATCDDFLRAMQDASGYNLTQFALWYSQSGTPELTVSQQFDAGTGRLRLSLQQHTPETVDQHEKAELLIPVRVELLAGADKQQHLLLLTEAVQHFEFDGFASEPVVVWLAHFSAPVKLLQQAGDSVLLQIAAQASDGVARWDAMQQFWGRKVRQVVDGADANTVLPPQLLAIMQQWLRKPEPDLALTAELLTLPDFDTLAEQYAQIPVDAILQALHQFRQLLAKALQPDLLSCYQQLPVQPYQYTDSAVGHRRLKAVCLNYLLDDNQYSKQLLKAHYQHADNMTDEITALTASQKYFPQVFDELIHDFSARWQHDVLAMDKAFALLASEPSERVFSSIEHLQQHPLFSWKNPNRVRALFSAFCMRNPAQFHRDDGKGYQLLQQTVAKLDAINPQVAARLITPLLSWRRFDSKRQQLMRDALQLLASSEALSNDLYEKVNRSLN